MRRRACSQRVVEQQQQSLQQLRGAGVAILGNRERACRQVR